MVAGTRTGTPQAAQAKAAQQAPQAAQAKAAQQAPQAQQAKAAPQEKRGWAEAAARAPAAVQAKQEPGEAQGPLALQAQVGWEDPTQAAMSKLEQARQELLVPADRQEPTPGRPV